MKTNGFICLSDRFEDAIVIRFKDAEGDDMPSITISFSKLDDAAKYARLVIRSWKAGFPEVIDSVLSVAMGAHSMTIEVIRNE